MIDEKGKEKSKEHIVCREPHPYKRKGTPEGTLFFSISYADAEGTGTYKQTSSMKLSDSVHFLLLAKKSICSNKTTVCRKKVSNYKDKSMPYSFGSIGP